MKQTTNNTQAMRYQYTVLCLVTAVCFEVLIKILKAQCFDCSLVLLDFTKVVCKRFVSLRFSNKCIICRLLDF